MLRPIEQIAREISKRRDLNLKKVCDNCGVNYQTVSRAIKEGKDPKESTLIKLSQEIDLKIILIDKDL